MNKVTCLFLVYLACSMTACSSGKYTLTLHCIPDDQVYVHLKTGDEKPSRDNPVNLNDMDTEILAEEICPQSGVVIVESIPEITDEDPSLVLVKCTDWQHAIPIVGGDLVERCPIMP